MTDHTLTSHEHVRFEDGDHVIVHSSPGGVQVTGMIAGEYIEYAGSVRDAMEQAHLLETGAPDALWALAPEQARRIATALDGAAVEVTPDDSERVALDDGHADVDVIDQHVEVTVKLGGRVAVGVALTASEATRIGKALTTAAHRANAAQAAHVDLSHVGTVTDLWRRAQASGVPASALIEQVIL